MGTTATSVDNKLVILDVGHGNCAVVHADGRVVVIDAGLGSSLLEYLSAERIRRLDTVWLSHADQDHVGGLLAILSSELVEIGVVRLNTDSLKGSDLWDDLLFELELASHSGAIDFMPALVADGPDDLEMGNVRVEVVAPSKYLAARGAGSTSRSGRRLTSNSVSAVVRVIADNEPVATLAGDIDDAGLEDLARTRANAQAPVLVFPHHGGTTGTPNVEAFVKRICEAFRPTFVIFSVGRGKYDLPRPDVVGWLRRIKPDIRIACTELSQRCAVTLPSAEPSHLAEVFALGREPRSCCAGSLVFPLHEGSASLPDYAGHQRFIDIAAKSAVCRAKQEEIDANRFVKLELPAR